MRLFLLLLLAPSIIVAQQKNCTSTSLEKKVKDAVRTYVDDEYEISSTDYFNATPQQKIEFKKNFDSDFEYVLLLITSKGASQGSIEVLDKNHASQEKEQQLIQLETDFTELEFEPDYDESYFIKCSVNYKQTVEYCAALVVLQREVEVEPKRK